ncbi:TonB-dependent receptor [Sphingobacterium sp.]|uniref:SusC/RagA family TonB-linked outer membrane protein n=1 Tax=Sphingobacterium sp. TaxID=341027 RepID=UPI0031CF3A97
MKLKNDCIRSIPDRSNGRFKLKTLSLPVKFIIPIGMMLGNATLMPVQASIPSINEIFSDSTVKGIVKDEKGQPLQGTTITLKGSNKPIGTDSDGKFSISVPDEGGILLFSRIGYEPLEIPVTRSSLNLNVILKVKSIIGEEVVVVGYGSQKRNKITGSITSINGDEIRKMPVTNNLQSLAGRVPGLISLSSSGRPGSGASVSIRGVSSYNNAPALYVIDGTIRNSDNFAQLDPSEIESISVLKDAGSAAVYGVRATNGVIVITTKRGKTGKPTFSLNSSLSFDRPTRYPKVLDAYNFAILKNEAAVNMGLEPFSKFTEQQIEDYRSGKLPSTDWQKLSYKSKALTQYHNFSVNGGSDFVKYYFNFGLTDQKGIYDNLGYKRYNFRSNTDVNITKSLKAAINLEGRVTKNTAPNVSEASFWQSANGIQPDWIAYYPDGLPAFNAAGVHPVEATKKSGYSNSDQNLFIGQLNLTQQITPIPGLSASGNIMIYRDYSYNKSFNKQFDVYTEDAEHNITKITKLGTKTTVAEGFSRGNSYTLNLSLNYSKEFGKHSVNGLFLYEQYKAATNNFNGSRTNFPFTSVDQLFAGANDDERTINGSAANDGRIGFVGRLGYDYDQKYLFEVSFREDASYRFAKDRRWGFFPSVSAGWVLSKESFLKDSKIVDNLKIRGTYGILGNDIVGGFQYKSSYSISGDYYFNETPVKFLVPGVLPNPALTWESTATGNLGIDASFWKRKLFLTFDAFQRHTYDIYAQRNNQYPGVFGATLPAQNYGKVDARGFELVLGTEQKLGDFSYQINGNFSFSRNKVKQIDYNINTEPWNNPIGKPIGYTTGYVAQGLYATDEQAANSPRFAGTNPKAGDIQYEDLNKDGIIDSRDITILSYGGATPEIMYGLNFDFSWHGIDLNIFFQGVGNRKVMYNEYTRNMLLNGNSYSYFLDRWTPENTDASIPRAWEGRNPINDVNSSFWFRDANFLRLKNIQLGYSIPKSWTQKMHLTNIRLYANAVNLAVFSKQKDFDPEYPGGSGFYYPQNKSIVFGANISF